MSGTFIEFIVEEVSQSRESNTKLFFALGSRSSSLCAGILRVFRLLRSLRPLRVINRAPGLKLVVQTLMSSLRPIGNIVLICCTFFIIFGILGVQLFKGEWRRTVRLHGSPTYCLQVNCKLIRSNESVQAQISNDKLTFRSVHSPIQQDYLMRPYVRCCVTICRIILLL